MLLGEVVAAQGQIEKRVEEILAGLGGMDSLSAVVMLANQLANAEVAAAYYHDELEAMKRMRLGAYEHSWTTP